MPIVWEGRNTLYKVALVVLIVGLPVHLASLMLPFWLELNAPRELRDEPGSVPASYGLWQICFDSQCTGVHSTHTDIVGGWFYSVQLLMLWAFVLHALAVILGTVQNFLSRRRINTWVSPFWRRMVHRDCELPEDVGFVGGFLGQAAHIVFMLFTKEQVKDGATYSLGFAFGFLATGAAVLATLALTKAHFQPLSRPPAPQVRPVELQDVRLAVGGPRPALQGTAETEVHSRNTSNARARDSSRGAAGATGAERRTRRRTSPAASGSRR